MKNYQGDVAVKLEIIMNRAYVDDATAKAIDDKLVNIVKFLDGSAITQAIAEINSFTTLFAELRKGVVSYFEKTPSSETMFRSKDHAYLHYYERSSRPYSYSTKGTYRDNEELSETRRALDGLRNFNEKEFKKRTK